MQNHYNFERIASTLCDFICSYNKEIQNIPITKNSHNNEEKNDDNNDENDEDSKKLKLPSIDDLDKIIPDNGEEFETIFEQIKSIVISNNGPVTNFNHPLNFSNFPTTCSLTAILGEILTSTVGGLLSARKLNPILAELESLMIDWYGNILGIPKCFRFSETVNNQKKVTDESETEVEKVAESLDRGGDGGGGGCFQDGISDIFHNIILAAIKRYTDYCIKSIRNDRNDHIGKWRERTVVYASEDCCPIISQICTAQMLTLRLVETNRDGVMTSSALQYKIDLDTDIGLIPILIIGTFGTFRKFAFDEIKNIGILRKMYQACWFHVDGTYGGDALILKRYHQFIDGFETADSIAVSLNQWTHINPNCIALWIKNLQEYQNFFRTPSGVHYYEQYNRGTFNIFDYNYYGLSTTYRSKALSIWITLRLYGKNYIEKRLRKAIYLTERMCELLQTNRQIEIVQLKFTFLNFVLINADDEINEKLFENLIQTGRIIVTSIKLNGRFTIRFSVLSEHTKEKHIVEAVDIITSVASKFSEFD